MKGSEWLIHGFIQYPVGESLQQFKGITDRILKWEML